jgi:diguanylate cyclase (GGDEF)-like protein
VYDRPALTPDPLLLAAIRAVARTSDPDAALDELLEIGLRVSGAERAAALLWDADRGRLVVAASRGLAPDDLAAFEAGIAESGHPVQLAAHERLQTSTPASADGRVTSGWPIVIGRGGIEEPIGALSLEGGETPTADVIERVTALADLVAIAIDRARLASDASEHSEWLERVGNSDMLTGLANARTLARVIELEIARAARQGSELSLAMFYVDDLTTINDNVGRAAGDDVLREVAAVIGESVRFVDTVARWGGDEFMLVAPGATGTTVVRRIVESVASRPAIGGRRFTVSAGLARFPADGTSGEELVQAATAALRAAQAAGPGTLAEATHEISAGPAGGNGPLA